jgi:hypothetical protein
MRDHRVSRFDNLAISPSETTDTSTRPGEARHKDQAHPELTKEKETAPNLSLDPVKQERKATTSRKHSSGSDNT